jgi:hypothetical protein
MYMLTLRTNLVESVIMILIPRCKIVRDGTVKIACVRPR